MADSNERVTVTLPAELLADIDRRERNRSRFIREAVRRELERRKLEAFRSSLDHPHEASAEMSDLGLGDWLAEDGDDPSGLLDPDAGLRVRWEPGTGWIGEEAP